MGPRMSVSIAPRFVVPSLRARFLQRWIHNVEIHEEPWRGRFFAALPAGVRAEIEGASPNAWLPVDHHVTLADVLYEAFGPARAHDYYRREFVASLARPPFESLALAGARVFGMTPAAFLRWSGRVYQTVFQDCGSLRGEVMGPGLGKFIYERLPAKVAASDPWFASAQGSMYGIFDFVGKPGVVRVDKSRRGEGRLELVLEWTP
jgi:hypothetical protein